MTSIMRYADLAVNTTEDAQFPGRYEFVKPGTFSSLKEKEWWYSYTIDRHCMIYFAFFFYRSRLTDHVNMLLFDLANAEEFRFEKNLRLTAGEDRMLSYDGNGLSMGFDLGKDDVLAFTLHGRGVDIDLEFLPGEIPAFTKYNNFFTNYYFVYHEFKSPVSGLVEIPSGKYEIDSDHTYIDHCFGLVPGQTGWHWLAVQNDTTMLASLNNYGLNGQKYTQFFLDGKWHRLQEDVSFEYRMDDRDGTWRVTSPSLDLVVTIIKSREKVTRIPPLIGVIVNLVHREFFVIVTGSVRVDSQWMPVEPMAGVMEEHYGKW